MSTRSRSWVFRRRVKAGGQFFTTGPVMDPESVPSVLANLELQPEDPPVYLEITPPMSLRWVRRLESVGAIPVSDGLRERLDGLSEADARAEGWRMAKAAAARAREVGFAGIVLMGLRFETVVGEAADVWHGG
jgi:5,10-methylenetetrahydrofolate reductase